MINTLKILCFHMLFLIIFICGCTKEKKTKQPSAAGENQAALSDTENTDRTSSMPDEQIVVNEDPDCVEFVALWAAGDIAEKLGKDKKWVFLNYTVDLLDVPPTYESGNIIGKLRASSYARIIARMGDDYKVESPVGKVQGWISNEHVKTTSWKNPKTRKLCK